MAMSPDTISIHTFIPTLFEVERLVVTRANMIEAYVDVCSIGRIIMQKVDTLVSNNVVVCRFECLSHIERLAEVSCMIREGTEILNDSMENIRDKVECNLRNGNILYKIMQLKLDGLMKMAVADKEIDRFHLCDRLVQLATKLMDFKIHSVISTKCSVLMNMSNVDPSQLSNITLQPSDDDEDAILTPDDSDSASGITSLEENSSEQKTPQVQDARNEATSTVTAMSVEVEDHESRIRQLETGILTIKLDGGTKLVTTVSGLSTTLSEAEKKTKDQEKKIADLELINTHLRNDYNRLESALQTANRKLSGAQIITNNPRQPPQPLPILNPHHPPPVTVAPFTGKLPPPIRATLSPQRPWQWHHNHHSNPTRPFTRSRDPAASRAYTFANPFEHRQQPYFDEPPVPMTRVASQASRPEPHADYSRSECGSSDY